ncbi:MAG: hypothetical protein ACM30F_04285 [Nitrospirota bacterium]|nr:hypothetical protein [Nitrospirota bacterium]
MITTKGRKQDRERGLVRGANKDITKPLNIRAFRETVLKLVPRSG